MGQPLNKFVDRYNSLRSHWDSSDQLLQDLIVHCSTHQSTLVEQNEALLREIDGLKLDLRDAVHSRRECQTQLELAKDKLTILHRENNRNPYVLVLIDGDGLLFQDHWIKQGLDGGKKAAYDLRAAIAEQCGDRADETEIIAKVYANLSGLTQAMSGSGIDAQGLFKSFTQGFTQAKASFDFIDVGPGKERADAKIRETTRWNLRNQHCQKVFLGICHDAGYAPFLDEVLQDDTTRQRVTILEGTPTVRVIAATNVKVLNLTERLFRSDKIVNHNTYTIHTPASSTSSTSDSPRSASAVPATAGSSWAGVTGATPPPQISTPLGGLLARVPPPRQKSAERGWNPGPRGLDKQVECPPEVLERMKRKRESERLCNNHYLRGPCLRDGCPFVHDYQPTAEEKNAVALMSRLNPCTAGQYCEFLDCIYGHHCPSVRDTTCIHPFCRFSREAHPPGTSFKNARIDENNKS